MKYKSCRDVENSMFFILDSLTFCCNYGSSENFIYKKEYNGEIINLDYFLEKREEYRNKFKSGNLDDRCKNCGKLEERDWDEELKISHICIAHHSKCSCNCFYCNFSKEKRYWNKRKSYNISNVFKKVLSEFPMQENFYVNLVGGECSEYSKSELNTIINETIKHNGFLYFTSSGMFYSKEIAQAIKKGRAVISISPDSGRKETYEKIKRVKYYDNVWKNIEKYSAMAKDTDFCVMRIKYIIIPKVNDNAEEFNAFIERCLKLNSVRVEISIEYNWYNKNKDNDIDTKMLSFLEYIRSYEDKIEVVYKETAIPYLRKYRSDFKYE